MQEILRYPTMSPPRVTLSTQIIVLSIFILGALATGLSSIAIWLITSIDGGFLDRERHLIKQGLHEKLDQQLIDQGSVAVWDDAVLAIRNQDAAWLAANLVEWQSEYYGYERVYLLSPSGVPLRAAHGGKAIEPHTFWHEPTGVISTVSSTRHQFQNRRAEPMDVPAGIGDFISLGEEGVAIITVVPIVPSSPEVVIQKGSENYLVAIDIIDDEMIDLISNYFLIDELKVKSAIKNFETNAILELLDRNEQLVANLTWKPRAPIREAFLMGGPLIVGLFVATSLAILSLFSRLNRTSLALEQSEKKALSLAYHDQLSLLANRASFNLSLKRTTADLREKGEPFALFYIDLDRFKGINDTRGHAVGDEVIRQTGERLNKILRSDDVAARLGGDEFAIIARRVNDRSQAEVIGSRIVQILEEPFKTPNLSFVVGASVGCFLVSDQKCDADTALQRADRALYKAKSTGRKRLQFFEDDMLAT